MMIRQLFDQDTWTYTYLLADAETGDAALIDPVASKVERDLALIDELGLKLRYVLDTHVHADHVTAAGRLRERTGATTGVAAVNEVACVDQGLQHGDVLPLGKGSIEVRATPGHTHGCLTFVTEDEGQHYAFTGDALFVRGCGRTDFQMGDAATLYHSIHDQIFSLPEDTVIYPGHDYRGHQQSTVGEEKQHNPRLKIGTSEGQFVDIMANLKLANPKYMDVAVPANLGCGVDKPRKAEDVPNLEAVTPQQVTHLDAYRVIDVRSPGEFTGPLGHIEGAELVPLPTLADALTTWKRDEPLLVVCKSGGRSSVACATLRAAGFERVTNLDGGMLAWDEMRASAE